MKGVILVLGVLLLLAGFGALFYTQTTTQSQLFGAFTTSTTQKPFEQLGYPLIIGGVVLLIVGAALPSSRR